MTLILRENDAPYVKLYGSEYDDSLAELDRKLPIAQKTGSFDRSRGVIRYRAVLKHRRRETIGEKRDESRC